MVKPTIKRRYMSVGGRVIHYRRAGSGPPVVIFHPSPTSSAGLVPLIERLGRRFTVFAFDTPGFGESDALKIKKVRIRHLAKAQADALVAMKMPRCAVFGMATGSCIALELARRHPERVSFVALNVLPITSGAEQDDIVANYFPPFRPRWDGSHLTGAWTRHREHQIWSPWYLRKASARENRISSPEQLHARIIEYFRAGDDYRAGYRAAFLYDAVAAVKDLTVPALFLTQGGNEDKTTNRLHLLPKLKRGQVIRQMPPGTDPRMPPIEAVLAKYAKGRAPADPAPPDIKGRIRRSYLDLPEGQVLARALTDKRGRPLLMLHDGPGSSAGLEPLMRELGKDRPVFALDLPGNGDSDRLRRPHPNIADYANVVRKSITRLGLRTVDLYGVGSGASVAMEVAASDRRAMKVVLERPMLFAKSVRRDLLAKFTPPIDITWDGGHLYRTWFMLRDQLLFWPWYNPSAATRLGADADFSAAFLHNWTLEVLKGRATYHLTTQAAFRHDGEKCLPRLRIPTLVCSEKHDPMSRFVGKAARLAPNASVATLPARPAAKRRVLQEFFDA